MRAKKGNGADHAVGVEASKTDTPAPISRRKQAEEVIAFLNQKSGRNFRPTPANCEFIESRLKEGYTVEECRQVVAMKVREWRGTEQDKYLRPATLFNRTKFNQYVGFLT